MAVGKPSVGQTKRWSSVSQGEVKRLSKGQSKRRGVQAREREEYKKKKYREVQARYKRGTREAQRGTREVQERYKRGRVPDSGCPRGRRERYATAKSLLLGLVGRAAKKRTGIGDLVGEGRGGGGGGEFKEWEEFEARQVFSPYALCATPETLVESRRCFFHSFKSLMMPHNSSVSVETDLTM